MGRPRKDSNERELDFKEQQAEFTESPEVIVGQSALPVYNRVALSIAPHPETGRKHVVEIPFNDEGQVGKPVYLYEGDGMDMARERFKIDAQMKILKSE